MALRQLVEAAFFLPFFSEIFPADPPEVNVSNLASIAIQFYRGVASFNRSRNQNKILEKRRSFESARKSLL